MFKDICGNQLEEGSFIVYPSQRGDSSVLKFGKVVGFKEQETFGKTYYSLKVVTVERDWQGKWTVQNNGRPVFIKKFDQCLIVSSEVFPDEALKLLSEVH